MNARDPMLKKQNPFQAVPVVGKTNWTSHSRSMSKTKKKTTSGMVRPKESPILKRQTIHKKTPHPTGKEDHNTDRHPTFSEIWPSTEPSSSSNASTSDVNGPKLSTMKFSGSGAQQAPMLARYVERFRHGQPQSREERQQIASTNEVEPLPFWWASSSSLPSSLTPEKSNKEDSLLQPDRSPFQCRGSPSILSDFSQCEPVDSEILQLQEKASRLLEKGDFCPDEDSIPVSSDGLGCSDFSSPVSADEPARRPVIPSLLKCNTNAMNLPQAVTPSFIPTSATPTRPEDDILFKWRLRRKMEKAREWTQSQHHSSYQNWQGPHQSHPMPSEHPLVPPHRIYTPDLSQRTTQSQITHLTTTEQDPNSTTVYSHPATAASHSHLASPSHALAPVLSHMHLLCDILPCPNKSSHSQEEEKVSERFDSESTIHPQTTQNFEIKHVSKMCVSESVEKVPTKNTEALKKENVQLKSPEKNEKNTSILPRGQKKSSGVNSRQKSSKKTSTEQHQQRRRHSDSNLKSTPGETPSPSPIHSALGQVVTEVLFPTTDLSPAQNIPSASPSPSSLSISISAPPQSNESIEVISQLLQEAEDSDEEEFEDDALLQVLRKQRKWVKEQIREVDTLLKEFRDEQKD